MPECTNLSLDIVSIRESHGNRSMELFYKMLAVIKQAASIRRTYAHAGTITRHLKQLAQENGISLRTLYRLESTPFSSIATP